MLDKTYRPAEVEAKFDRLWQDGGYFAPRGDPGAEPYCIVIPPPNVTGSLHMGHALNNTIQDALIRFHRMLGRAVLWQPGIGSCRHRDPDGGRARAGQGGQDAARARAREVRRAGLDLEGAVRRPDQPAAAPPRRLGRLVARALHHGRGALARGPQGVRRAAPRGADLQGQAPGQLGLPAADRGLRSRGRPDRGRRPSLVHPLSDRGAKRPPHHRGDDPARDHARRYRRRGASRRSALSGPRRAARHSAAGRPAPADRRRRLLRSPRRARARSRSPPATTSTTSRSAAATAST